jgi:hypothetical protein
MSMHPARNFTLLLSFALLGVAVAVGAAPACIPDLPADFTDSAPPDAPSGSSSGTVGPPASSGPVCGNNIIELDAGEQCDPGPFVVGLGPDASFNGCTADCTVSCPGGLLWPRNNHCYQLIPQSTSALENEQTAAKELCTNQGGHVATFASEEEFQAVASYYLDAGGDAGPFWVGMYQQLNKWTSIWEYEPGWASNCRGCYAHLAADASAIPLADSRDNMSFCVEALPGDGGAPWTAIRCMGINPKIRVVCEREPTGQLSTTCNGVICIDLVWTYGQKRYVYNPLGATDDVAAQTCRGKGGRLVVLQTRDEREQLWKELQKLNAMPRSGIWIGLSLLSGQDGGEPLWVWDDGANADAYPLPWAANEPHTSGTGNTTRAYMLHLDNLPDDTLAQNIPVDPSMFPSFVCEITVDAGSNSGSDAGMDAAGDAGADAETDADQ